MEKTARAIQMILTTICLTAMTSVQVILIATMTIVHNTYKKISVMIRTNRSERCTPIKFLGTTFDNSNNLLELYLHAYKMNPDFNPNPNNPNNLLDTIILLGYNVWIECKNAYHDFALRSLVGFLARSSISNYNASKYICLICLCF